MPEVATIMDVRGDGESEGMLVTELIEQLTALISTLPEEARESATVQLSCYGDYPYASLDVHRNETAAERMEREAQEEARDREYKAYWLAEEKRRYEQLKAKFG